MPVIDGDDVTITSSHWGPHGSPQGNMYAGTGFYDFEGGNGGPHTHGSAANGCATCHMAEGSQTVGGHTFEMGEGSSENTSGCMSSGCHSNVDNFDAFGGQTATQAKLDELAALLEARHIIHFDVDDGEWHVVNDATYPANLAAAAWNFFGVVNDKSLGVHNPAYIRALLQGSIDAVNALP
jgi:hypothetical protein